MLEVQKASSYWFPGVVRHGLPTRCPQIYLTWISLIDCQMAALISRTEGKVISLHSIALAPYPDQRRFTAHWTFLAGRW